MASSTQAGDKISIHVHVQDRHGKQHGPLHFSVSPQMSIRELKSMIERELAIPSSCQIWIINQVIAEDGNSLSQCGVNTTGTELFLYNSQWKHIAGRDYISHQNNTRAFIPNYSTKLPLSHVMPPAGWKCPRCTMENAPTRPGCEACTEARPSSYLPPRGHVLSEREIERIRKEEEADKAAQLMKEKEETKRLVNYETWRLIDEEMSLLPNQTTFTCILCFEEIEPGDGVNLRECVHSFCKDCLKRLVEACEDAEVTCPYTDNNYTCHARLQQREIKELVSLQCYEKFLSRSLSVGEAHTMNSFHCRTSDCEGWCEYEDNVNNYFCDVCHHTNCLSCKVQHEPLNCKQYQDELRVRAANDETARQTLRAVEDMLRSGQAMTCPGCEIIIQKNGGCAHMKCSYCHRDFQWNPRVG